MATERIRGLLVASGDKLATLLEERERLLQGYQDDSETQVRHRALLQEIQKELLRWYHDGPRMVDYFIQTR